MTSRSPPICIRGGEEEAGVRTEQTNYKGGGTKHAARDQKTQGALCILHTETVFVLYIGDKKNLYIAHRKQQRMIKHRNTGICAKPKK